MEKTFYEKKIFKAELANLFQMLIWIRERITKYFTQEDLEKIELASEEVIVNIIKHAYKKKKGKIILEIFLNENLTLIFKDKGPKFNPLSKKKGKKIYKKKTKGIFIIFQCMDEIFYQRKNLFNILTLQKKRNLQF